MPSARPRPEARRDGDAAGGPSRVLDLRGLACPVPVARTAQAVRAMAPGEVIEVLATDPDAELDVRAWAARSGDEVVSVESTGSHLRLVLRRG